MPMFLLSARRRYRRAAHTVPAAALLAATLACSACSSTAAASPAGAAAGAARRPDAVTVSGAVIVQPVAAGDPANLVFTVVNGTSTDDEISGVTAAVSSDIVLNNTLAVGAATDPIALAAHATVRLEAFGPDVWVFDPAPLRPGSVVPISIHFRHAAAVTVDAEVRTVLQMAQTGAASADG